MWRWFTCWACKGEAGFYEPWDMPIHYCQWIPCTVCKGTGKLSLWDKIKERYINWRYA